MIKNQRQFNLTLSKFSKQISADLSTVTKLAALKVFTGVVMKTPVKTGVARGSWLVGVGSKPGKIISAPRPGGPKRGTPPVPDELLRLGKVSALRKPRVIFISNYVHYIGELEAGSSKQSSQGMVALTLREVKTKIGVRTR